MTQILGQNENDSCIQMAIGWCKYALADNKTSTWVKIRIIEIHSSKFFTQYVSNFFTQILSHFEKFILNYQTISTIGSSEHMGANLSTMKPKIESGIKYYMDWNIIRTQ